MTPEKDNIDFTLDLLLRLSLGLVRFPEPDDPARDEEAGRLGDAVMIMADMVGVKRERALRVWTVS
jgi:hypothetical protein